MSRFLALGVVGSLAIGFAIKPGEVQTAELPHILLLVVGGTIARDAPGH